MAIRYKIPLMLLLTILLSMVLKWTLPDPIKNTEMRKEFWLRKTHPAELYDFVMGGDSRTYRGISPNELSETWDHSLHGMNCGYSSIGLSTDYLDYLAESTKPKGTILLAVTPHSLTAEAVKNEFFNEHKNTKRFDLFKGLYLSRYLKYTAPYKVTEVLDHLTGNTAADRYFETFYPDQGWAKSYRIPEDTVVALEIYEGLFSRYQVSDSVQMDLFEKVTELTTKGYTLYAFRIPTMRSMIQLEDSRSGFKEIEFQQMFDKAGGTWLDIDPSLYHTYDGSHLHYESAIRLSRDLGTLLKNIR